MVHTLVTNLYICLMLFFLKFYNLISHLQVLEATGVTFLVYYCTFIIYGGS